MFYLGIDIAKSSARYVLLDNDGEKAHKAFTLRNSNDDFEKLLSFLKKFNLDHQNLLIGIEATGIWWENIFSFLTQNNFKIVLLNPHQTKKFREALRLKAKTDDIDAFVIAGLLRSNQFSASFIPEENIQTLRETTKLRYQLMQNLKNYERQVFSLLGLIFPEYEKSPLKNPFSISAISIFKAFPTAKHLADAKPKQIEKIVRSIKGNTLNIDRIQELINIAKKSIYSGRAKISRGMNLNILLAQIQQLFKSIAQLDSEIDSILSPNNDDDLNFPGANLLTIPGVGPKTVAAILSAVGIDGKTFKSVTQFIGHIGFYPQIYQSGETKRDNKISKQGPSYLRHALYISAVACLRHNPEFKNLYNKKCSQGKKPKQALICVAKKIAELCLSMLKSGEVYLPQRVFMQT
ncbi:IS110 family transposase [bacterium]